MGSKFNRSTPQLLQPPRRRSTRVGWTSWTLPPWSSWSRTTWARTRVSGGRTATSSPSGTWCSGFTLWLFERFDSCSPGTKNLSAGRTSGSWRSWRTSTRKCSLQMVKRMVVFGTQGLLSLSHHSGASILLCRAYVTLLLRVTSTIFGDFVSRKESLLEHFISGHIWVCPRPGRRLPKAIWVSSTQRAAWCLGESYDRSHECSE